MIPTLQTSISDVLLSATIVVCALLAIATIVLMSRRTTPAGEDGLRRKPPFDPVLLGSAVIVIIMAGIAWFSL